MGEQPNMRRLKLFVKGKHWAAMTMICLFIALYFPDLFIIADVTTCTALDVILTLVFAFFVFEWITLSLLDMSYLFGFFWFMDFVGSFSIMFDICYMLAAGSTKATHPLTAY